MLTTFVRKSDELLDKVKEYCPSAKQKFTGKGYVFTVNNKQVGNAAAHPWHEGFILQIQETQLEVS